MGILIHCGPIAWHRQYADAIRTGLANIGISADITSSRERHSDVAILLGTTLWRQIEADGSYLLVDRASIGDPSYAQLVWNGHGRRGNHCVPDNRGARAKRIFDKLELKPWKTAGPRTVLCGQTETYSPHYDTLDAWYKAVMDAVEVTHFRKHPAGDNPTDLPGLRSWLDVGLVITLNSSIGVEAIINGRPVVTMDEAAMAWDASSHWPNLSKIGDRKPWLDWLAWTQWHVDEITDGKPIKHLFEAL